MSFEGALVGFGGLGIHLLNEQIDQGHTQMISFSFNADVV